MANSYEYLPVPSFSGEYGHYTSPELLYSYARFTQKGGTLAGGQGELPLGTILSRGTGANSTKFVKFTGAAGQKAVGFLRRGADAGGAGAPDQEVNIVLSGIVKLELVQAAYGGAAAAAATITAALAQDNLNGRQDDANSFISF